MALIGQSDITNFHSRYKLIFELKESSESNFIEKTLKGLKWIDVTLLQEFVKTYKNSSSSNNSHIQNNTVNNPIYFSFTIFTKV